MSSVNKVIIVGRLGQDPEVKQFQNGGSITTVSIATSERWTDKQTGEQKEQTEWHRVSFQNRGNYRLGDTAAQYLRKGSLVYVEGSLHTRKWTDQQGIERYTTEIKASQLNILSSNNNNNGGGFNQGGNFNQQNTQFNAQNFGNQNYPQNQNQFAQNNPFGNDNFGGHQPNQPQNNWQGQNQSQQGNFGGQAPTYPNHNANQGFQGQSGNVNPNPNPISDNPFLKPPHNAPQGQPKAVTPPGSPVDDDMPF